MKAAQSLLGCKFAGGWSGRRVWGGSSGSITSIPARPMWFSNCNSNPNGIASLSRLSSLNGKFQLQQVANALLTRNVLFENRYFASRKKQNEAKDSKDSKPKGCCCGILFSHLSRRRKRIVIRNIQRKKGKQRKRKYSDQKTVKVKCNLKGGFPFRENFGSCARLCAEESPECASSLWRPGCDLQSTCSRIHFLQAVGWLKDSLEHSITGM